MASKEDLNDIIDELLKNGIEITMFHDGEKVIYNLNLNAKSHLYLHYDKKEHEIRYNGRYDDTGFIDNYFDLISVALDYYHMKKFASSQWMELFVKEGRLTKQVSTVVTYK